MQASVHTLTPAPEVIAATLRARRIRRAIGGSSAVADRLAELAFGSLPQACPAPIGGARD